MVRSRLSKHCMVQASRCSSVHMCTHLTFVAGAGEKGTAVTGFLEYVLGADVTAYDFYTAPKSLLDISSAALTEVGMSG